MSLNDFRYSARSLLKNPALYDPSHAHDCARGRREHIDLHRRKGRPSQVVLVSGSRASGCREWCVEIAVRRGACRTPIISTGAPSSGCLSILRHAFRRRHDQRDRRTRTSFWPLRDGKFLFNATCSAADRAILRRRRRQSGRRAGLGDR